MVDITPDNSYGFLDSGSGVGVSQNTQIAQIPSPMWFLFGESKNEHHKHSNDCPGCRWNYPTLCSVLGCGGFVHIEYLDDPYIPFVFLCDICDFKILTD
jgi:hypothetical protein